MYIQGYGPWMLCGREREALASHQERGGFFLARTDTLKEKDRATRHCFILLVCG
jgi:hypothetical protein